MVAAITMRRTARTIPTTAPAGRDVLCNAPVCGPDVSFPLPLLPLFVTETEGDATGREVGVIRDTDGDGKPGGELLGICGITAVEDDDGRGAIGVGVGRPIGGGNVVGRDPCVSMTVIVMGPVSVKPGSSSPTTGLPACGEGRRFR